jgi:hypothetical protein
LISKKIILSILAISAVGIAVFGFIGVTKTNAESTNNRFTGLVQAVAQKFGLDQSKVQTVFDDYMTTQRQGIQQKMQQGEEDRLTKLVQDGKISDAQKTAILNELAALRTKYNPANFKNMTAEERKTQFDNEQNDIKSWAASQGIDASYLTPGFGMGRMRGMHGWYGIKPSPTPAK